MNKAVLPVEYSVVSAQALLHHLTFAYELPYGSKVSFFHSGIHDTYLITNGSIHLMMKVYRKGWKSLENVNAELEILLYLKQKGIDVSVPYRDRNGKYVQELIYPEGARYAVIFMYAPGVKLTALDAQSAALFGQKLGSLHVASTDMEHESLQRTYYLPNVFNSTMESIASIFNDAHIIESFRQLYFKMDSILGAYDTGELRIGVCHGDPHFENAHFKKESGKVTFFDFDFCGNGYLLYDIGSFFHYERANPENIKAFLSGYQQVLRLSEAELSLIPFFTLLMKIFHLGARASNADGSKNPLWSKPEIAGKLKEIEREAEALARTAGVETKNV